MAMCIRKAASFDGACRRGLTVLEAIAILLVLAVLIVMVMGVTVRIGDPAPVGLRCKDNLKQVYAGLFSYSQSYGQYFPGRWNGYDRQQAEHSPRLAPAYAREDLFPPNFDVSNLRGDDDLSPLSAADFVADIHAFNCPQTTDWAEPERFDESGEPLSKGYDIMFKATQRRYTSVAEYRARKGSGSPGQLSYEYLGEVAPGIYRGDINAQLAWVAHDIDDREGTQDWTVDGDNHGTAGGNVLFLDGRVEWVKAEGWTQTIRAGHDERLMIPDASKWNWKGRIPADAVAGEWDSRLGWPHPALDLPDPNWRK